MFWGVDFFFWSLVSSSKLMANNILLIIWGTCLDHINATLRKSLLVVALLDRYTIQTYCEGYHYFLSQLPLSSLVQVFPFGREIVPPLTLSKHMNLVGAASYGILASEVI